MAVARFRNQQISERDLLSVAANLLVKSFHDCPRIDAKRRYRAIEAGKRVLLTELSQEDGGKLRAILSLEQSELRGKLNFTLLRDLAGQLLASITSALQDKRPLNSFSDERHERIVFLLPATVQQGQQLNMMVLCVNTGTPGELGVELMFIDPEQFRREQAAAG